MARRRRHYPESGVLRPVGESGRLRGAPVGIAISSSYVGCLWALI